MVYLVRIIDNENRARYLKSDRTFTEYWNDAEEFTQTKAKEMAKQFNQATVIKKFSGIKYGIQK